MAIADLKGYFKVIEKQRNQMKADLADFEQALKDGYITEDKLQNVIEQFNQVDTNYQRLVFDMFMLNLPRRPEKRKKYLKQNKQLIDQFSVVKSDQESIVLENEDILVNFRKELRELTQNSKKSSN